MEQREWLESKGIYNLEQGWKMLLVPIYDGEEEENDFF